MGLKIRKSEIVKAEQANCLYLAVAKKKKKKKDIRKI
jgi:hypothetical protein